MPTVESVRHLLIEGVGSDRHKSDGIATNISYLGLSRPTCGPRCSRGTTAVTVNSLRTTKQHHWLLAGLFKARSR